MFFRYNLPCNIENDGVFSRSTLTINIEENIERPNHNEAPQESNEKQPGPFRTRTFARVPIPTEDTTEPPPAKQKNFTYSKRGKFTTSTVRKGQSKENTPTMEPQPGPSQTKQQTEPQQGTKEVNTSRECVPYTPILTGRIT